MSATINLVGPSTVPGAPVITPETIDLAVNAALAANAVTAANATLAEAVRAGAAESALASSVTIAAAAVATETARAQAAESALSVNGGSPAAITAAVAVETAARLAAASALRLLPTGGDDSAAVSAAFAALPATGGAIVLGPGTFFLANPLTFSGKPIVFSGAGRGITNLIQTHSGIGLTIAQTDVAQYVGLRGFSVTSTAAFAVPRFLDVSFPIVASSTVHCFDLADVTVRSSAAAVIGAQPGAFTSGLRLTGAWGSRISSLSYTGPVQPTNIPYTATSAVEVFASFNTEIPSLQAAFADSAVLQSSYSEYINLSNPVLVACNYGIYIANAPLSANGNRSGLSYYISGGELDVLQAGAYLANVNNAWIRANDLFFGRVAGGTGVISNNSNNVQVFGNKITQGGANVTATGVYVMGTSRAAKVCNNILNVATGVRLDAGTKVCFVAGNSSDPVFVATTAYINADPSNSVTWPFTSPGNVGGNYVASTGSHLFAGSAGQSLAIIQNIATAVNINTLTAGVAGSAPIFGVDGADTNIDLVLQTKNAGAVRSAAPFNFADPATSSIVNYTLQAASNGNGVNLKLVGNGATTPAKTLRVQNGVFALLNNAYTTPVFTVDDVGNSAVAGTMSSADLNVAGTSNMAGAWTAISGPVTASTGSITTGAFTGQYKKFGRTVWINLVATVTTNGTGAGTLRLSLPFAAANQVNLGGRETLVTGKAVTGTVSAGLAVLNMQYYDNTYPGVNGASIVVSGVYEATT